MIPFARRWRPCGDERSERRGARAWAGGVAAALIGYVAIGAAWAQEAAAPTVSPAAGSGLAASAAPPAPARYDRETGLRTVFGFETVSLPGDERMGLVGGSLLFGLGHDWWAGPAVYGAATGERGGLFTGGAELQKLWRFGEHRVAAGLYAGGGGGAAAPVGSGLMLRPALSWLVDFGPMQAGLSFSAVRFPSGDISSPQFGVVAAWDGVFRSVDASRAGDAFADARRGGLGVDDIVGTGTVYDLDDGRGGPTRRIGLVGGRLTQRAEAAPFGGRWQWGVETAAAAQGDAAGYMEVLGSLGWDRPVVDSGALRVGVRGALGLGGGGAVPTGGGLIGKLGAGAEVRITPLVSAGVEIGMLKAADTALQGQVAQGWVALALEPATSGPEGERLGRVARLEWVGALQHYANGERKSGADEPLDTIGLKVSRYFGPHLYGTIQGHSAYAGGVGAYSVGLIGAGAASAARGARWRGGAELLAGAAGGGGMDTAGGLLVQGLGWLAWVVQPELELRVGLGALAAPRSTLRSPIAELSISRAFGQGVP